MPNRPWSAFEHDDETDLGKVVALGQHLRADQQADVARVHALQRLLERAAASHGITVDAGERHFREQRRQRFLDALRALPDGFHLGAAVRADRAGIARCVPQ